jgi:hypothetical protein
MQRPNFSRVSDPVGLDRIDQAQEPDQRNQKNGSAWLNIREKLGRSQKIIKFIQK